MAKHRDRKNFQTGLPRFAVAALWILGICWQANASIDLKSIEEKAKAAPVIDIKQLPQKKSVSRRTRTNIEIIAELKALRDTVPDEEKVAALQDASLSDNQSQNEPSLASEPETTTAKETDTESGSAPNSAPNPASNPAPSPAAGVAAIELKRIDTLDTPSMKLSSEQESPLIFDIPVTYNNRVRDWIRVFQTSGRHSFRRWLERSARYQPLISYELTQAGLPQDLVYVAMIESGFSNSAVSHAHAMGMWQFIASTGRRYGLRIDWWIDERKDFHKATKAAIRYMKDLHSQFNSWYLVAASYNMGENGVRRLIKRHGTNNFWELADRGALPRETRDYVPKILAATLISKAPGLYGFRDLEHQMPLSFEVIAVPGGTDLINLANYLGVSEKYLKELNPELIKGFIPRNVSSHVIRVPKGSTMTVSQYVRLQAGKATN